MIVSKTVFIQINSTTIDYWISKGYVIPTHKDCKGRIKTFRRGVTKIEVLVADLPKKSNVQILAKCDTCQLERKLPYSTHTDTCWACNLNSQKGVKHPRYLHRVKTGGTERAFDLYLQRRYKIDSKTYFQLLESQQFRCAICLTHQGFESRRFALDHDHKTNKVRGILCQPCNTALGLLKDNKEAILRIIKYLEVA